MMRAIACFIMLAVAVSAAGAQMPGPETSAERRPTSLSADGSSTPVRAPNAPPIVGVVRDTAGAPVPNVQVIIPAVNRGALTDQNGRFVIRGLPAGTYHITTLLIGYAPGHADVTLPESGSEVEVVVTIRPTAFTLSTVQVTASPTGIDPRNLAKSTVELSGQALQRNLGTSIAQTLSNEPGVSVRFDGPAATAPVIRGLTGERILVLQDGERAGDLSSTSQDHAVSIDPLTADRIEVVRGPASLLYGNNALGGVVNVISNDIPTTIPSRVHGYATAQGESATPGGAGAAGLTIPLGESFALLARGGGRRVDDMRFGGGGKLDNSYFRNFYGVGGFGFARGEANGGLIYRGYRFNYGLPSADAEGAHIEGHRDEVSARSDMTLNTSFLRSLRLNATAQWYGHDEIEESGAIGSRFDLKTQTLDAMTRTNFGGQSGALGASGLFKQYSAIGEEALTPAANSNGAGVFAYQEIAIGATGGDPDALVPRLQFGGRYDIYTIDSKAGDPKFGPARSLRFNNVSGSVGVSLPLGEDASLGLSAARAFRAPTVEELFSNAFHAAAGTYDRGNPNLDSETNQGFDGILRFQGLRVNGQLSGYFNAVANFISPNIVKDTLIDGESGPITVPLNQFSQADAKLKGLEGRLEFETARNLILGVVGDLVRGELEDGTPLPFLPPARFGGLVRWDAQRVSANVEVRHAFKQDRVPLAVTPDDPSGVATDAYTLVNLSFGLNVIAGGRVNSVTLRADNLTDAKYRDSASRIKNFAFNPGRNISLVYKILF
jgi:iron complex outermembrane receptor protein